MRFDFSAASLFLSLLEGRAALEDLLRCPAYQAVFAHGQRYGSPLNAADVQHALDGAPSPFYGLRGIAENLPRIRALLAVLQERQHEWLALAGAELLRVLPGADLEDITVYPIIGYDMGIGLGGAICMNLNTPQYLAEPHEFLYFIIHEAVHVLYERSHNVPPLAEIRTPAGWLAYFGLWLQNEGFAVYAPYRLRRANQHLADRDYQVLEDPARRAAALQACASAYRRLAARQALPQEAYLETIFGDQRLTYRAGCHIFSSLAQQQGLAAASRAFYLPPKAFLALYTRHFG